MSATNDSYQYVENTSKILLVMLYGKDDHYHANTNDKEAELLAPKLDNMLSVDGHTKPMVGSICIKLEGACSSGEFI